MSRIRTLAAVLAAASLGVVALVPGTASAQKGLDGEMVIYTLTQKERKLVCGSFQGTLVFDTGYSVECSSGEVTYYPQYES